MALHGSAGNNLSPILFKGNNRSLGVNVLIHQDESGSMNNLREFYSTGSFIGTLQDELVSKGIGTDLKRYPNLYAYFGVFSRNPSQSFTISNPNGTLTISQGFIRGESSGSKTITNWEGNRYFNNSTNHVVNICTNLIGNTTGGRLSGFGFVNSEDVHGNLWSIFTTPNAISTGIAGRFGSVLNSNARKGSTTIVITNSDEQSDAPGDMINQLVDVGSKTTIFENFPGLSARRYLGYFGTSAASISLAIDTSGSMTLNTVRASYDLFKQKCAEVGLSIFETTISDERWAVPHNKNFLSTTNIICITVIDESSPSVSTIRNDWLAFRSNYPNRDFWLLQPGRTKSELKIPSEYESDSRANYSQVSRDNQNINLRSDWFSICNLESLQLSQSEDDVNYTDNRSSVEGPRYLTEFNKFFAGSGGVFNDATWLIEGYFLPPTTGTYQFFTKSDDASYLWVGDTALSGYTINNAVVNNGGLHTLRERSGTINLTAGIYYPIRVIYGNQNLPSSNPTELTISFSGPNITKRTNGNGYFFSKNVEVTERLRRTINGVNGELNFRGYRVVALSSYASTDGYDGILFYGKNSSLPYGYVQFTSPSTYNIIRSSQPPSSWVITVSQFSSSIRQLHDTLTITEETRGALFKIFNVFNTGTGTDRRIAFSKCLAEFIGDTV
jgi:hypothetical protein